MIQASMSSKNQDSEGKMMKPAGFSHLFGEKAEKSNMDLAPIQSWSAHHILMQHSLEMMPEVVCFLLVGSGRALFHVTALSPTPATLPIRHYSVAQVRKQAL